MKALIIMREKDCGWLRQVTPDSHPGLFPICNKPLLEYLVDFAILHGCSEVRLALDEQGNGVESYFGSGSRWGIDVSYGSIRAGDTLEQILDKNSQYCADGPLLIMDGLFFIHYDKAGSFDGWQMGAGGCGIINCGTGSVLYAPDRQSLRNISSVLLEVDFALSPLECLDDIFQISMQILSAEQQHYVLPGYGIEKGVILGRNVEIGKDVTIHEPVILGNNVRILGDAVVGPLAVVGNDVIVDKGTVVEESVLMDGSYLGRNLSFKRKMIRGKRLFAYGEAVDMEVEDAFLLSSVHQRLPVPGLRFFVHSLAAFVLTLVLSVPYFLLAAIRKMQGDWIREEVTYLRNSRLETFTVRSIAGSGTSLAGRMFSLLFLDRYPLLPLVLLGRLRLVGNRLLEDSTVNREIVADFQDYSPGVFGYSEAEGVAADSREAEVTERFYAAQNGFGRDGRVLLKILFSRALT